MVSPAGLEPATLDLEGRCSVQLSYGDSLSTNARPELHERVHPRLQLFRLGSILISQRFGGSGSVEHLEQGFHRQPVLTVLGGLLLELMKDVDALWVRQSERLSHLPENGAELLVAERLCEERSYLIS
jgi:hypothetical protein